ncbi:hypothetical protein Scep_007102 [Stephania cephalantha]|uniref:Uncharacterized protein n=1 Tax=Stephania cephalantha TaxID=152367 RepID=A0AAP0PNI6_9MAGN
MASEPDLSTWTKLIHSSTKLFEQVAPSMQPSLASLRNSHFENPNINDFSHIRKATNNFLTKRFSSSSASQLWRCTIQGKKVVVIERKFRYSIETLELRRILLEICKCHHSTLIKPRRKLAIRSFSILNVIQMLSENIGNSNIKRNH